MIIKVITFHMAIMAMMVTGTITQMNLGTECTNGMVIITIIKQ